MKNLSVQKILTNLQYIRIYIYVAYSRLNGWTNWAEFFGGHSWMGRGYYKAGKNRFFFSSFFP